jgi:hypothetical protein
MNTKKNKKEISRLNENFENFLKSCLVKMEELCEK